MIDRAKMTGWLANPYVRRLGVAVLTLAVLDPFVPGVVERLERRQYESNRLFRFENSDLFALGPLTAYLREHPRGDRPRTVFFGDSVVWGYYIHSYDTVPAHFQRIAPDQRVLNLGINGFATGSAYLISKAIIDSIDTIYLFNFGVPLDSRESPAKAVNPRLPSLIPVEDRDVERFAMEPVGRVEAWLHRRVSVWRLYRDSYRLQAGLFGTSTRLFLYLNKASLVRDGLRWLRYEAPVVPTSLALIGPNEPGVRTTEPVAVVPPDVRRRQELQQSFHGLLWDFSSLVRGHGKRAVVVELDGHASGATDADLADLNAVFNPEVRFIRLSVPNRLLIDGTHFNAKGARAVAEALHQVGRSSPGRRGS